MIRALQAKANVTPITTGLLAGKANAHLARYLSRKLVTQLNKDSV